MGTRGQVIIQGDYGTIYLYRHFDAYPGNVLPILEEVMRFAKECKYKNIGQIAKEIIEQDPDFNIKERITLDIEYLYFFYWLKNESPGIKTKKLIYEGTDKYEYITPNLQELKKILEKYAYERLRVLNLYIL